METTNERLLEIKEILEKEHGREFSLDEAQDALNRINVLAQIIADAAIEKCEWENKLRKYPKGFHLERSSTCMICGSSKQGDELWYDKYGIKCIICQKAIDKKIIPVVLMKNTNNWYNSIEMEIYFGIKAPQIRKLIKQNKLKARTILRENGKVYFQVFLIKDNKGFLPPKTILKTTGVKEIIDGQEWIIWKPWYKLVNPQTHLSKYQVVDFLKIED